MLHLKICRWPWKKNLIWSDPNFYQPNTNCAPPAETGTIAGNTGSSKKAVTLRCFIKMRIYKENKYISVWKEPAWIQVWHLLIFYLLLYWLTGGALSNPFCTKAYRGLNKRKQPQSIEPRNVIEIHSAWWKCRWIYDVLLQRLARFSHGTFYGIVWIFEWGPPAVWGETQGLAV